VKPLPHVYAVNATAAPDGDVELAAEHLPFLHSAPPADFGGPGDRWSPETLLAAAVGDCFVLTFRAVARAAKLPWVALHCTVAGTLDRVEHVTRFTGFDISVQLRIPAGADAARAHLALEKAEKNCLISNSLVTPVHLHADVVVDVPLAAGAAVQAGV
jgi:organic hydroperoxide reductase OsmC/OhrA